jgi:hypothetical protein
VRAIDPFSVLSIGNGNFAFPAYVMGLQSIPSRYADIPLATQSSWGWHRFPNPDDFSLDDVLSDYVVDGRNVSFGDQQGSASSSCTPTAAQRCPKT